MASKSEADQQSSDPWKDQGEDTTRLVFFSDAVFAVALTLLVIGLQLPTLPRGASLLPALANFDGPSLLALLISFAVISGFWRTHHRLFTYIARYDATLLTLNFVFLLGIVLQPFVTELISRYGDHAEAVALYAGLLGLTMLLLTGIWAYATRAGLVRREDLPARVVRFHTWRTLVAALLFLVTAGLPFVMPPLWVPFLWLLIIPAHRVLLWLLGRVGNPPAKATAKG